MEDVNKTSHDPAMLRRVTVASVRRILDDAAAPYRAIQQMPEKGVVRVDVTGWPGFRLQLARERVAQSFDGMRTSDFWLVRPTSIAHRWRPWRSWVTIRDPGTEWRGPDGRDFLGNPQ